MGQPAEGGIEFTVTCFDFFGFPFILVYFVQMSCVSEKKLKFLYKDSTIWKQPIRMAVRVCN